MWTSNNQRIAKNTFLLYFRMLVTMLVSLYTSRVVLNSLGVSDYGVYNVVGGMVGMFALVTSSLSGSISRFLTYELGRGNSDNLKTIFSTSVNIQIGMAVIVMILMEVAGVWFLNNKMEIPDGRLYAANWVLQFSIATFLINLVSVPYNASVIAHEHMKAFAYVGIFEVILKLAIAFLVMVSPVDRLVFYALLLLLSSLTVRLIYGVYCRRHFAECSYCFVFDKSVLKSMTSFAGWSFFGSGSHLLMTQGVNMLMNVFFGVTVNAARGIAEQVNHAVTAFVTNFTTALNPQITKSYAAGEKEYMLSLVCNGARYSYYLLLFLSLPILFQTETILRVWLSQEPDFAAGFVRMTLLISLVSVLSNTMVTAMLATGDIKKYQLVVGGTGMLVFPLAWILYKMGFPAIVSYAVQLVVFVFQLFFRLILLRKMISLSVKLFFEKVLIKVVIVSLMSISLPVVLSLIIPEDMVWCRFFSIASACGITSLVSIIYFGLGKEERLFVIRKAKSMLLKINI